MRAPSRSVPIGDSDRGRLLIACADAPGIVAAVSRFLFECGANIVHSDQHATAPAGGQFFMRVVFDLPELERRGPDVRDAFAGIAATFGMEWRIEHASIRKRLGVLVSRQDHCLLELLWRWRAGDLKADIALVISNHPDLREDVVAWGIPFHHVPVHGANKVHAEQQQLALLQGHVDVVVLARYMQILTGDFCRSWPHGIINIHHSFLPAFVGARPHDRAHHAGVKLIGATAHYVTEELDAGPIIEQDVERVDHRHGVDDLKRIGRSIERRVLARAVEWHVEDRVLVHGNKTVVFS
ncbi:MAG: formyltetrahydrofolate deformylase [Chloroflexota bacterium]